MALFKICTAKGTPLFSSPTKHDIAQNAHRIIFIRDGKIASDETVKK